MRLLPEYTNNTAVRKGRNSVEFLAISLRPLDDRRDFNVYLYRYYIPGRCDTYSFQWKIPESGPSHIRYFSDGWTPLAKALKLVEEDFNRPNVVEMCVEAFRAERIVCAYQHDFLALLAVIAPKSKTYRAVKKLCEKTMDERQAKIAEMIIS